jgi:hypothetical protein
MANDYRAAYDQRQKEKNDGSEDLSTKLTDSTKVDPREFEPFGQIPNTN